MNWLSGKKRKVTIGFAIFLWLGLGGGCNRVLPTYAMPLSGSWGTAIVVSMPRVVADSALLAEALPAVQTPVTVTSPDGTTITTTTPPPLVPVPAFTIEAVDAAGVPLEGVCVLIAKDKAVALCNAYCAGSHGWKTCWDARVHSLKSCPILAVGLRCCTCPVLCYATSEPTYRADYFKAVHSEKYKGKCKGGAHVFGKDADQADAAVACVMASYLWMP